MKYLIPILFSILTVNLNAQFENLETAFTTYKIPPKDCVGIQHFSGSRIFIPESAFNLKNVNNGDSLTLYYREFFDPIDFLVNKLDLHYQNSFMISGGMFELFVKLENKIVPLNMFKEIRVEFIKKNDEPLFNNFKYNQDSGWDKLTDYNEDVDTDDWGNNTNSIDTVWQINPITFIDEQVIIFSGPDNPLFQTMSITSYGLFNYDYIIKDKNAIPLIVDFELNNTKYISTVFVIYENMNSLIYYSQSDFKENFRLLSDKSFSIFAISNNNKIAKWNQPDDFNLIALKDKNYTFKLTETKQVFKTLEDLKTLVEI